MLLLTSNFFTYPLAELLD